MASKGEITKNRLMDVAEKLFLSNGFGATTIDEIIKEAGITKGGFFYHYEGKNDLAYALMKRYQEQDALLFSGLFERAKELTDDPLQQMLVFVKLLAEMMEGLGGLHPGCLVASVTYETDQVNDEVKAITAEIVMDWRRVFKEQIEKINEVYEPQEPKCSDDLADLLSTIIEGGIIVSRALNDAGIFVRQLLEYRSYIGLLYKK